MAGNAASPIPNVPNLEAIPSVAPTAREKPAASTPTYRRVRPPNRNCKIGDAITANVLQAELLNTVFIKFDEFGDAFICAAL
jgi:hypothetical protein